MDKTMTIKDQCKAVLADGKRRTVAELAKDVAARFGRTEGTVATTIYTELLKDSSFQVRHDRPKTLSLAAV